jgi:hypothetical protein
MNKLRSVVLICVMSVWPTTVAAQTVHTFAFTSFDPNPSHLNLESASADSLAGMGELIASTLGKTFPETYRPRDERVYVLAHILRWSNPVIPADKADAEQQVQHSRWYVYSNDERWTLEDFEKNNRVFGTSRVWLLAVHLNFLCPDSTKAAIDACLASYRANYQVKVVAKKAAPLQHFAELASLAGLDVPSGTNNEEPKPVRLAMWHATQLTVSNPSDLTITPSLVGKNGKKDLPLGAETKFDNEGRYWWDVGIGVPIRSVKELKPDEESGTAVPKLITKTSAFATLDLFVRPIDVKASGLRRVPHGVIGLAHNAFFLGGGWGPAVANFYVAYQWNRVETEGKRKYERGGWVYGVELPLVAAVIKQLSK